MADNYLLVKGENGYMVKLKLVDLGDGTFGLKAVTDVSLELDSVTIQNVALRDGENPDNKMAVDEDGTIFAKLTGSTVEEALKDSDAVANVLTFSENIQSVEIWHDEATPQDFIVNGITIPVGPGGWRSPIGGTPDAEVTIPAGVTCIVKRLV